MKTTTKYPNGVIMKPTRLLVDIVSLPLTALSCLLAVFLCVAAIYLRVFIVLGKTVLTLIRRIPCFHSKKLL